MILKNSERQKITRYLSCFYNWWLLFLFLDISENFAASHRIYDVEVIEFSNDVSFILILPPVEEVCLVPGQNDTMTEKKDLTLLPVQVFEMSKLHVLWYGVERKIENGYLK